MSTTELAILLEGAREGDLGARDALTAATYRELRRMARAVQPEMAPHNPLQPTVLIQDAWTRLFGTDALQPEDRRHFFGVAVQALRRVLVDRARASLHQRRDARREWLSIRHLDLEAPGPDLEVLQLEGALSELETFQPRLARLVELRYFAGLSLPETATALGVSQATMKRDWAYARVWLTERLSH
ncbi:RNA polymerase [Myxococcus sp. CA051A]|uniref:ECF-type sigma factor n=1 Tax=unclassified Myxococcus TaxID=2648731 RepID=UPI00157B9BB4|nr:MULTISPECIES: ECF-type sigma factor [unclassified Myxococcus]NTX51496.1 RNA polymerase [Myxococcus sp. CA039A]NTX65003.1 RNA polymerase [Myxococcus sp. CA051A]